MLSIIPARKSHLPDLARLYKKAYKKHNIFSKDVKQILRYLEDTHREERKNFSGFAVALVEDKNFKNIVAGGLLVRRITETKTHQRWRISHFAIDPKYQDHGFATEMVQGVIMDARRAIENKGAKSIKLEMHTATKAGVKLFTLQGFAKQGILKDHYRFGEECTVLGLTIK